MKKVLVILLAIYLYPKVSEAQTWELRLGMDNGLSFVNRLPLNLKLNNLKNAPTSGAYGHQEKLSVFRHPKSEKWFYAIVLSHRVQSYKTKIYDTRPSVVQAGEYIFSDAVYSYFTLNLGYHYYRRLGNVAGFPLIAGLGLDFSYYYQNKIKLDLQDGKKVITNRGRKLGESFPVRLMPDLTLRVGSELDVWVLEGVIVSLYYKQGLDYLGTLNMPIFSETGIGLNIPILKF